ncbi:MAG: hypothetical protein ABI840_08020, partial [bacterium]
MEQIKFKTKIKNGSIKIPSKYKELENTDVSVYITKERDLGFSKINLINPYKGITDKKKLAGIKKTIANIRKE